MKVAMGNEILDQAERELSVGQILLANSMINAIND